MTREEAEKVAAIIATADGGCSVCVRSMVHVANEANLGWQWAYDASFAYDDEVCAVSVVSQS